MRNEVLFQVVLTQRSVKYLRRATQRSIKYSSRATQRSIKYLSRAYAT